ncbi:hypothetical protein HJFPF1_08319 [Paramyrothecium foliicola]|nr:hypothetical protein HJFPF1_08319 [Paramyrothecium foliicola]
MDSPNPAQAVSSHGWFITENDLLDLRDATEVDTQDQDDGSNWMIDLAESTADGVDFDHLLDGITGGSGPGGDQNLMFAERLNISEGKIISPQQLSEDRGFSKNNTGENHVASALSSSLKLLGACWRCKIPRKKVVEPPSTYSIIR